MSRVPYKTNMASFPLSKHSLIILNTILATCASTINFLLFTLVWVVAYSYNIAIASVKNFHNFVFGYNSC